MDRKACWYSVVRYTANAIAGEVINVGLILHSVDNEVMLRYLLLDENTPKVRAVTGSRVEELTYKSFKDTIEYYLKNCTEHLAGSVGKINIASPYDPEFLNGLYNYLAKNKLFLSEPTFSLTSDLEGLFNSLFSSYVGEKYLNTTHKEANIKVIVKKIFEERDFLNKKVATDIEIQPVPELKTLKVHVDFGFKNGVWNYLQALPNISNQSKSTEWFAKTKFLTESLNHDANFYIMYRSSELNEKSDILNVMNYLGQNDERIVSFDIEDRQNIISLCNKIEREAHDLEEILVS